MAEEQRRAVQSGPAVEQLVVIDGLEFGDGTIAAEIAGDVQPGAAEGARGFVGIAFRLQPDLRTYDAFYLVQPTAGQTIKFAATTRPRTSHTPSGRGPGSVRSSPRSTSRYVDLVPGAWTAVKIDVRGARAALYVHDMKEPTLIVNDLKTGPQAKGAVALWLDAGTVAHFRNLTVSK